MKRVRRATIAMKKTRSIEGKLFKDNYRRREMFNALVGSIALYGPEVWGWQNKNRMDRIKRK